MPNSIIFWDGNPGSLNITNQNNFEQIQNAIIKLNELSKIYPNANIYEIDLDTQLLALMNRETHLQFITNVNAVNKLFQKIKQDFCLINIEIPKITNKLTFVKDDINNYWKIIQTNLNKLNEYINEMEGED